MPLPTQVKKQADKAKKLEEEMTNSQGEPEQPAELPDPSEEDPETSPEGVEVTPQSTPDNWEEKTKNLEENLASIKSALEKESQRYKVLQGKYNAEIRNPRDERIAALEEKLASAEKFMKEQMSQATEEEESQFQRDYPDIYKMMKLREDKLKQELMAPVHNVERKIQENAVGSFYSSLSREVPDWEAINQDPEFLSWLDQKERYSPYTKFQLLQESFNMGNPEVAINLFTDFKNLKNPNTSGQAAGKPADMSKYASPHSSPRAPRQEDTSGKRRYKKKEISEFYRKAALGKLKITPEQKAATEAEFWRAIAEDRVDP